MTTFTFKGKTYDAYSILQDPSTFQESIRSQATPTDDLSEDLSQVLLWLTRSDLFIARSMKTLRLEILDIITSKIETLTGYDDVDAADIASLMFESDLASGSYHYSSYEARKWLDDFIFNPTCEDNLYELALKELGMTPVTDVMRNAEKEALYIIYACVNHLINTWVNDDDLDDDATPEDIANWLHQKVNDVRN